MIQMGAGIAESHRPTFTPKKLFIALFRTCVMLCFNQHCTKAACAAWAALQLLIQMTSNCHKRNSSDTDLSVTIPSETL